MDFPIRYCNFDGNPIPEAKLRRNKKTRFCSDDCRIAERDEWKAKKRADRQARGACGTCGQKLPQRKQGKVIPRVETLLEITQ